MALLKIKMIVLFASVAFLFNSCKKCTVDGVDVNSGAIKADVVIYPQSGSMTGNMAGNYVIDASSPYADNFEISINGGGREAVNYANYTILAQPVVAKCNASFERNVVIDHAANTVTYIVTVTQCSNCAEERFTENYVLVDAFPSSYTVNNVLNIVDKE